MFTSQFEQIPRFLVATMAPNTRQITRSYSPIDRKKRTEWSTPKKTAFFELWHEEKEGKSLRQVAKLAGVPEATARTWIKCRYDYGTPIASQRKRKWSESLGRPEKVTKEDVQLLLSPSRNPVRNQPMVAQAKYHQIEASERTLQRQTKRYSNDAKLYKQAYVDKVLSDSNHSARWDYGQVYGDKTIDNFWRYIMFTDECHIDLATSRQGHILRERGTRYNQENIQQRPSKTGNEIHIFAWITWDTKSPQLYFYNDEEPTIDQPKRPRKPVRHKRESDSEWQQRLLNWEQDIAALPPKKIVKPLGNSMTQEYYCNNVLPVYIDAIQRLRLQEGKDIILQEDNDPSHGTLSSDNVCSNLKAKNWIASLFHPGNSPELNPQEGIWNILKQMLRTEVWEGIGECKQVLQRLWSEITQNQVQKRIAEMPVRAKMLQQGYTDPIKSDLW
jgi:transposase